MSAHRRWQPAESDEPVLPEVIVALGNETDAAEFESLTHELAGS